MAAKRFLTDIEIEQGCDLYLKGIQNAVSDPDMFVVADPTTKKAQYRTGAQLLADVLPTATRGQMLFKGASAWEAFSGMFWDDVNTALLVGYTTNPATYKLAINGTSYLNGTIIIQGSVEPTGSVIIPGFTTATSVLSFRADIPDGTNVGIRAKAIATVNRDGIEILGHNGIDFTVDNGTLLAMRIAGSEAGINKGFIGIPTVSPVIRLDLGSGYGLASGWSAEPTTGLAYGMFQHYGIGLGFYSAAYGDNQGISWFVKASSEAAPNEGMRLTSKSWLAVGNPVPVTNLSVDGGASSTGVSIGSDLNYSHIITFNTPEHGTQLVQDATTADFHIDGAWSSTWHNMLHFDNGTGNVSINGAGGYSEKLRVIGANNNWTVRIVGSTTDDVSYGLMVQAGSGVNDGSFAVKDHSDTNTFFYVRGDGFIGANTLTPTQRFEIANGGLSIIGNIDTPPNPYTGSLIDYYQGMRFRAYSASTTERAGFSFTGFESDGGNGVTYVTILPSGNFGLNTVTPYAKFQLVDGDFLIDLNHKIYLAGPNGTAPDTNWSFGTDASYNIAVIGAASTEDRQFIIYGGLNANVKRFGVNLKNDGFTSIGNITAEAKLDVDGAGIFRGVSNGAAVLTLGTTGSINAVINSGDEMFFNIDSNNDQTGAAFYFGHNAATSSATLLMKIKDNGQVVIPVATGTSPFDITSETVNTHLNADLLDGSHASAFQVALTNPVTGTGTAGSFTKFTGTSTIGSSTYLSEGTNIIDVGNASFSWGYDGRGILLSRAGLGPRSSLVSRDAGATQWVDVGNSADWAGVTIAASGGKVGFGIPVPITAFHFNTPTGTSPYIYYTLNEVAKAYIGVTAINGSLLNEALIGDVVIRAQQKILLGTYISGDGDAYAALTITNDKKIGVRISNPAEVLHLNGGNIKISTNEINDASTWNHSIYWTDDADRMAGKINIRRRGWGGADHSMDFILGDDTSFDTMVSIMNTGNVSIGYSTTDPTYKLQVNGTGYFAGAFELASTLRINGVTYTFPNTGGNNGDVLVNNGSNSLVWAAQTGSTTGGITSLGGQTGGTQTFSRTNDTNVTLVITSSLENHGFALGWTGTLADARIASAATWNAKVSFPGFGTSHSTAAYGDHTHSYDNYQGWYIHRAGGSEIVNSLTGMKFVASSPLSIAWSGGGTYADPWQMSFSISTTTFAMLAGATFTGAVECPSIKITTGAAVGRVLTSDSVGAATWAANSCVVYTEKVTFDYTALVNKSAIRLITVPAGKIPIIHSIVGVLDYNSGASFAASGGYFLVWTNGGSGNLFTSNTYFYTGTVDCAQPFVPVVPYQSDKSLKDAGDIYVMPSVNFTAGSANNYVHIYVTYSYATL